MSEFERKWFKRLLQWWDKCIVALTMYLVITHSFWWLFLLILLDFDFTED